MESSGLFKLLRLVLVSYHTRSFRVTKRNSPSPCSERYIYSEFLLFGLAVLDIKQFYVKDQGGLSWDHTTGTSVTWRKGSNAQECQLRAWPEGYARSQ